MFLLPNGAVLIDNPGIREIQLGDSAEGLEKAFSDIVDAARNCRFKDCTHHNEPGCVVLQAVKDQLIPEERLASYHRLTEELIFQSRKSEIGLKRLEKERFKKIAVDIKKYKKFTGKP
jgi:ribosome biogenesis GTPase